MSPNINYQAMEQDDDYDPAKPEYIIPASVEEAEHAKGGLLMEQIASLEAYVEHIKHEYCEDCDVNGGKKCSDTCNNCKYQHVLADMRHEAILRFELERQPHAKDAQLPKAHSEPTRCLDTMLTQNGYRQDNPSLNRGFKSKKSKSKKRDKCYNNNLWSSAGGALAFPYFPPVSPEGECANPVPQDNSCNPYHTQYTQFGQAWDMTCSSWWTSPALYQNPYNSPPSFAQGLESKQHLFQ